MLKAIITILAVLTFADSFSQHTQDNPLKGKNRLSVLLGHTHISAGVNENNKRKWLALPSWVINYDHWVSNKWAVGLHNDIIIEDFVVQEHLKSGGGQIERSYPVSLIAVGLYKPASHSTFILGSGAEFAEADNPFITRVAYEWECIFQKMGTGIQPCLRF